MERRGRWLLAQFLAGAVLFAGLGLAGPSHASTLDGCREESNAQDLNGDGFDDATVGDPYAAVNGQSAAGAVTVLFGDADGRIGEGPRRVITQADLGETPEAGDRFGWDLKLAIAATDSNCADLLIGAPGEDIDDKADAGIAHLASFATDDEGRPTTVSGQLLTQADGRGTVEAGDEFGSTVALVGTPADEERWFVIGAPGETLAGFADAGAVNVINGVHTVQLSQGKLIRTGLRVPGAPQSGDRFGASLEVGSLNLAGTGGIGMIIGAPGDTVTGRAGAGSVTVVHREDEYDAAILLSQDSPGVPGAAEVGDGFGSSVALSPRVGSNPRTLAVGAPGEDARALRDTGSVTLFTNRSATLVPRTAFSQGATGVPGANEAGDRLGHSLAFHGSLDLWVGVPSEDIGSVADAGAVLGVSGWLTEDFPLFFRRPMNENAETTPGAVGAGHEFGRTLGSLSGDRENVLLVSSAAGAGSVYVSSDASRTGDDGSSVSVSRGWVPAGGGVPVGGAVEFGWSVSN